jgi:ribonuclease P protein component
VLPKNARLTSSEDFARATKSGLRVTSENFVGYLYISPAATSANESVSAKCGLIINKTVGGSVVRHSLARKVRHSVAANISKLPQGSLLVLRALSKKDSGQPISLEIDRLIEKLLERAAKMAVK